MNQKLIRDKITRTIHEKDPNADAFCLVLEHEVILEKILIGIF